MRLSDFYLSSAKQPACPRKSRDIDLTFVRKVCKDPFLRQGCLLLLFLRSSTLSPVRCRHDVESDKRMISYTRTHFLSSMWLFDKRMRLIMLTWWSIPKFVAMISYDLSWLAMICHAPIAAYHIPRQSSYGNSFGFQFCFLDLISHQQVYINITARYTTFTRPNRKTNGVPLDGG